MLFYFARYNVAQKAYYRFSVMAAAFHRPSSFTMVMVPDTCAAAVLSVAVSRAAEVKLADETVTDRAVIK